MDSTPDSLLRVNRLLLMSIGLWPYQNRWNRIIHNILTAILLGSQIYLQMGGLITAWFDPPIFLAAIPPVLISFVCITKFVNFLYNFDKMKYLLDIIMLDFVNSNDMNELEILNNWTKNSRKNTIIYAVMVYGFMFPFMLGPLVPIVVKLMPNYLLPNNGNLTIIKPLMFHLEYLLDTEKYYVPLVINSYLGTLAYITVAVAIDTMFLVYVQHACAIFQVIGYRLEHLVENHDIDVDINLAIENDKPYRRVIECIIKHSQILEYTQIIESANSMSFLFQLGVTMVCISFTGFQAVMTLDHLDEAIKYGTFTLVQTFLLFFESWPSQRLASESIRICEYTMQSSWYLTSIRSRKLLQLLVMRSLQPCQLTAGNIYILNLENFSSVVKTSMSYFTVLCSTQ